jgi:2,4-diaminopentanoate dehydrogenase
LLEHFHDPETLDPEVRQRIEEACERGGASIYSAGPSPGFVTESLPLVLTSIERRLDCYRIEEYADMSERNSPEMYALLGFGGKPDAVDVDLIGQGAGVAYGSSLRRLARALSLEFDDVTVTTEVATAAKPVETAVGTIEAGTLAAWRIEISGIRDGKPLMQMIPTWYLTTDLEPGWTVPFPGQGWHVVVQGDLPLDVSIRLAWPTPQDGARRLRQREPPINAVPNVCEAPPGILSTFALPQIGRAPSRARSQLRGGP